MKDKITPEELLEQLKELGAEVVVVDDEAGAAAVTIPKENHAKVMELLERTGQFGAFELGTMAEPTPNKKATIEKGEVPLYVDRLRNSIDQAKACTISIDESDQAFKNDWIDAGFDCAANVALRDMDLGDELFELVRECLDCPKYTAVHWFGVGMEKALLLIGEVICNSAKIGMSEVASEQIKALGSIIKDSNAAINNWRQRAYKAERELKEMKNGVPAGTSIQ